MSADNLILWVVRKIGWSGLALVVGCSSFGFGTFPSAQGHEAYVVGFLLVFGAWVYERFLD
jgi:hypothetical protein